MYCCCPGCPEVVGRLIATLLRAAQSSCVHLSSLNDMVTHSLVRLYGIRVPC